MQYWNRHVCVGCGSAYRYQLPPPRTGGTVKQPAVPLRPCPTCGLYQPDMIASRRIRFHLMFGFFALLVTGVVAILGVSEDFAERGLMCAAAVAGAVALLGHLIVVLWNPNRNPEANRARAKKLLKSGTMELLRGRTPEREADSLPRWGIGPIHGLALAGMALGVVVFLAAELVRLACGWPLNPEWYPGVVGPGDKSRFYFPERFHSVKGLWKGEAGAEVLNAPELGLARSELETTTKHDTWAGTIWTKSEEKNRINSPWVGVQMPDFPQLVGKKLHCGSIWLQTTLRGTGTITKTKSRASRGPRRCNWPRM